MSDWQPIETAPKDGGERLVGWPGGKPCLLIWKTNHRIVDAHKRGHCLNLLASYWGDPIEYDDYDLAKPKNQPALWLDFPPLPEPPRQP